MEAFLDENPDFLESYVGRKVRRSTVERWSRQPCLGQADSLVLNVEQESLQESLQSDLEDSQELSRQGSLRKEGYYVR